MKTWADVTRTKSEMFTEDHIRVMEQYVDGARIERRTKSPVGSEWVPCPIPRWDWLHHEYRVA